MAATVDTDTDWAALAVRMRQHEKAPTADIAAAVGRSESQVRRVLARANAERAINGAPTEVTFAASAQGPPEPGEILMNSRTGEDFEVIPGQTTVDDHLTGADNCDKCGALATLTYVPEYGANFCEACAADPQATGPLDEAPPEDDPEHPDTQAEFQGQREMDGGEVVEERLKGTRQMALDFGPNADLPVGGTLKLKSDKLASGFFGLGDVVTGTFTARIVDVAGAERFQRASEEYRMQPQQHVALITDITLE